MTDLQQLQEEIKQLEQKLSQLKTEVQDIKDDLYGYPHLGGGLVDQVLSYFLMEMRDDLKRLR